MKKIILVEDSKSLAEILKRRIESDLDIFVDIAGSKTEAIDKIETQNEDYFMALLDLTLPDSTGADIVDSFISRNIPSLVLTSNIDPQIKEIVSGKIIVDYLLKTKPEDISYLTKKISRVISNSTMNLLVVDDTSFFRKLVSSYAKSQMFNVFEAENGSEALKIISENDIAVVVTDYEMPIMDGLDLTRAIRSKYDKDTVAVVAVSASEENDTTIDFLKYGANDFITKPFSHEEFLCRVNNVAEHVQNTKKIKDIASKDYMTKLYTRRFFIPNVIKYMENAVKIGEPFTIAMFDIDNFKAINDKYGHSVGDKVIKKLGNVIKTTVTDGISCRYGGEEFSILFKNTTIEDSVKLVDEIRSKSVEIFTYLNDEKTRVPFSFSAGICSDTSLSAQKMIQKADELLYKAKNNGKARTEI